MSIILEKPARLTLEMPQAIHRHLKIICAEDGISMHNFVIEAIEEKFEDREERIDAAAHDRGLKDIEAHGTISFEEMDKAMGV